MTVPALAGKNGPATSFAGIDVGGTNVKLGVVDPAGKVIASASFPTRQERGPEYAFEEARKALDGLCGQQGIELAACGLGTPGSMDIPRGLILEPSNLPGWRHYPVRDRLAEVLGLPVTYSNDANAAAYGEYWCGAGREARSLVFFTLGTGVGGGIIVGDVAIEGAHSLAAELGHVTVDSSATARRCSCGQRGHLEAYASATALVERCREQLAASSRNSSLRLADSRELTARAISDAAAKGDELARELVLETADWLAPGIALTAHVIDPELYMLGGAMNFGGEKTALGCEFLERVRQKAAALVFPEIARQLRIGFATLGADSGWIGAAGLACREWKRRGTPVTG